MISINNQIDVLTPEVKIRYPRVTEEGKGEEDACLELSKVKFCPSYLSCDSNFNVIKLRMKIGMQITNERKVFMGPFFDMR